MTIEVQKPAPKFSDVAKPYWDGLKAGRLLIQHCAACGKPRHYPRLVCDGCYATQCKWVPAQGTGRVHSWTVCHHAFHAGFAPDLPYTLLAVDLDEGVRAMGRLRRGDPSAVRIGLAVRFDTEPGVDGFALPVFDIATVAGAAR